MPIMTSLLDPGPAACSLTYPAGTTTQVAKSAYPLLTLLSGLRKSLGPNSLNWLDLLARATMAQTLTSLEVIAISALSV